MTATRGQLGSYEFGGTDAGFALGLSLAGIGGVGTYALGTDFTVGGGDAKLGDTAGVYQWETPFTGTAGTLTITTLTDTRIAGSFAFTPTPSGFSTAPDIVVTNGVFDLPVRASLDPIALPSNVGSKVVTTLNGAPFSAARATAELSPLFTTIKWGGSDYTFSLVLQRFGGIGAYVLSADSARSFIVTHYVTHFRPPARDSIDQWSTFVAGSTGSVIISSVTTDRVIGSFTAVLNSGNNTPLAVSGSFNIGLGNINY